MTVRHRERDSRVQYFGSLWDRSWNPNYILSTTDRLEGVLETTDDIEGNRTGANPFSAVKTFQFYPSLSGKLEAWWSPGSILLEFVDYPVDYKPLPPDPRSEFPGYSIAELHEFAWRILAETNPSTPLVSAPTFAYEMKDLPSLVKEAGGELLAKAFKGSNSLGDFARRVGREAARSFAERGGNPVNYLRKTAQSHLSWRWAIKPLIGDLRKLAGFCLAANQRFAELRHLRDGKTLRKRCTLGKYRVVKPRESKFLHSYYYSLNGWSQLTYTAEVWGSAEWLVAPGSALPKIKDDKELKLFARRLALGITTQETVAALWEATPWSWLADWFSNVSDVIAASNNAVGLTWGRICVMRRSKGQYHVTVDPSNSNSWATLSGDWRLATERKDRHPVFPVLPFPLPRLPILNAGKWSILASLAILKGLVKAA